MRAFIKRSDMFAVLGAVLCGGAIAAPAPASPPPSEPAAFVQAATQAGLMEIEAGKLAMNVSTNPDVKTFADRMITDHGRASAELAVIAKKKSITVPTDLDLVHVRTLKGLRGKSARDFEAAYAAQMVEEHAGAVQLFEANAGNRDSELAAFVELTLPVLREHKRLADQLKASLKK
jgi:putative membrane protein